ncbi:MAG: tRNA pseudouridine(55) synthase TruB [Oscillospiraceae bacterium]|nr:tRNA pseudouridine(55) synthase TruB [Oscillospiraceae bacterium]
MNGILLIDQPAGWTSMDVCAKLRGAFHEKRVGHSGTLDPMATGLLVVFLGRATRAVEFAEADGKTYEAGLRLGVTTDTQDLTGEVLAEREVRTTDAELEAALARFRGEIEQTPPMYSAVKIGGKPLYKIARKGGEVERKPRKITIYELERRGGTIPEVLLRVRCSKGTYIRTLCHDVGELLGCGGTMSALRRTAAGPFSLEEAHTLDEVLEAAENAAAERWLLPVERLFPDARKITLTPGQEKTVRNGGGYTCRLPEGRCRLYAQSGEFLALAELRRGTMQPIKSFFEV